MSWQETDVSIFWPDNLSFRQYQPMKLEIWTFSPPGRNFTAKISNFICWFWLKEKLPEQKSDTGLSCPDIEGPWKVWGDSDSWFPIQPRKKSANFIPACQKMEIWNFTIVLSKRYISSIKNCDRSFILIHWRSMGSLGGNWVLACNSA